MDLINKKRGQDMSFLSSEPMMYYGKIALLTMGAFAIGRMTRDMMS